MQNINLTPVIEAVISLCAVLITTFLIPYLKQKKGREETARLMEMTGIAVRAAEQMYDTNQEKLDYVLKYLSERGFSLSFDELRIAIESAVYDMKRAAQT